MPTLMTHSQCRQQKQPRRIDDGHPQAANSAYPAQGLLGKEKAGGRMRQHGGRAFPWVGQPGEGEEPGAGSYDGSKPLFARSNPIGLAPAKQKGLRSSI